MSGILSLKPEDEKRLHPKALEWFNDRRAEIQFEAPLEELSDDDLNTFLSDDEKREFQSCMEEISKGLSKCINLDEASSDLVTNAIVGLSLVRFEVNSLLPMRRIRLLLKDVHQRKVAKVKEEQRERDEEDRKNREQAEAERRKNEAEQRRLPIPAGRCQEFRQPRPVNHHLNPGLVAYLLLARCPGGHWEVHHLQLRSRILPVRSPTAPPPLVSPQE